MGDKFRHDLLLNFKRWKGIRTVSNQFAVEVVNSSLGEMLELSKDGFG